MHLVSWLTYILELNLRAKSLPTISYPTIIRFAPLAWIASFSQCSGLIRYRFKRLWESICKRECGNVFSNALFGSHTQRFFSASLTFHPPSAFYSLVIKAQVLHSTTSI